MKRFSPYIREFIWFYMWRLNITVLNQQYRQKCKSIKHPSGDILYTKRIDGYWKCYNWRTLASVSLLSYGTISPAYSLNRTIAWHRDEQYEHKRIYLPKRYKWSVLQSDINLFKKLKNDSQN